MVILILFFPWISFDLFGTALTYCHVFLNRQTAVAHQLVFERIEAIVREDTGENLKWRHLHAQTPDELIGILQWAGDQHGGQAKGDAQLLTLSVN